MWVNGGTGTTSEILGCFTYVTLKLKQRTENFLESPGKVNERFTCGKTYRPTKEKLCGMQEILKTT